MLSRFSLSLRCMLLASIAMLGTSCSRQASLERTLARAESYQRSGALDKAEVEYLNALKSDSRNGKAYAQLGLIYSEQGRIGKAFPFLREARELQPANVEVRAKLAMFYLAARQWNEARAEAHYILEHQPNHAEAPLLLAESALQPKEIDEAREYLQKLPTAQTAPVLTGLASLEFHQRNASAAEALLKRALVLDPKSAAVYVSLGTVYLAQKNLKSAEEAFASAWQTADTRSPQKLNYIRFKLQTGDSTEARKLLMEVVAQVPDCIPPAMLLVELDIREKKYDEALIFTQKITSRDPQNPGAILLTARLLLAKGDNDKALHTLEQLALLQPKNPEVHFQFARTYLAQGNLAKATASASRTLELSPNNVDAILLLADLDLKKGDAKGTIALLKPLIVQHPELMSAKAMLGRANLSLGNYADALSVYQEAAAAAPQDVNLQFPIALILRQQKKYAEARQVLTKVLELEPNSGPATEQLVDLDLLAGNTASARQRAEALLGKQPARADGYLLLAKISVAEKKLTDAETDLLKAIELQPDTAAAYYLLAEIYSQTHQDKKAVAQLEQIAGKSPGNASLFMRIALLHEQLKEYPAARDAYEKVLAVEPKFVPALNNLACLYSDRFNELDRGLTLATQARELAPLEPHVADTLGWILYKQGHYQQARTLLRESAAKSPDDASVQFHLGMAYYMMGEMDTARSALQHALKISPELPEKTVVSQRLAILGPDDQDAGPELRTVLEKAVADRKDDPVALTRLAGILQKSGEFDQAQKYLEAALAISPHNVVATLSLIRVHLARHETGEALELAKAARKQAPDDPNVGHLVGLVAFQTGDYQWAASLLQESAGKLPDDLGVLFDWAKSAYSVGRVADTEEVLKRIQKAQPLSTHAKEISLYLEMISLATEPAQSASGKIDQALQADPNFVPALFAQGVNSERQQNTTAARQAYEKALTIYPEFTPAKRSLVLLSAASVENETKNYDLAVQVKEAFPDDPQVAQALGILAYRKGEFTRAISLLTESSTRLGQDAVRTYYLGMAQYRSKDKAAPSTLQRALELGLKGEPAAEARHVIAEAK